MSWNQVLYDAALKAIKNLFADTSVSKSECRRNLQTLRDEIDIMIDALGDDEE